MKTLIFLVVAGLAVYWFGFRPGCGASGALACPDPAIEQGVGVTLSAKEVCRGAGYFCGRPIPLLISTGTTFRWDIGVVWSQGIYNGSAGVANPRCPTARWCSRA